MHKNKLFYQKSTIQIKDKTIGAPAPLVMGIINITPDSFYSGSRKQTELEILNSAKTMLEQGADILDLGAYSSRPNALNISAEEEWMRLAPILPALIKEFPNVVFSIDTFRADLAEKALNNGIDIINDISGGSLDPKMFELIVKWNCPYILMHMKGTPQTMSGLNQYDNLIEDILMYFKLKIAELEHLNFDKIILDPGFGFAKNIEQNFELLAKLENFTELKMPLLAGLSRKSMIYKTLGIAPEESLNGTSVLNMEALNKGANILRVHDVKEAVECVKLWTILNQFS